MKTSTRNPESPAPPDFLIVEETARIARIGRTTAYDIAREYETTAGAGTCRPVSMDDRAVDDRRGKLSSCARR